MNHIFYQTKTYFSNTGDVLINRALLSVLRQYGQLHANCSEDVPADFLQRLGISEEERISSKSEAAFVKNVLQCCLHGKKTGDRVFLFSGLGDMYGGSFKLALRNFLSGLIFPVFQVCGVTIVRIGRSFGPVTKLMAVTEWIRSRSLSYNFVRDSVSLRRCGAMGITNVQQCPDMAWLYHMEHEKRINDTGTVMVNLRRSVFDEVETSFIEKTLQQCETVLAAMESVCGKPMKVCVAYQIAEDRDFSRLVYKRLKKRFVVSLREDQIMLEDMETVYSEVDYHISNRMHSLLLGYKYGSLPIALIDAQNHTKISSTLDDCGLHDLIVDIFQENPWPHITYMVANRRALMEKLWQCESDCQRKIIQILEMILR